MLGRSTVGVAKSPFTGSQQAYEFPGEWWEAQFSLPPMARADAERWISFLLALRGRSQSFFVGDPLGKIPQGGAAGFAGAIRVAGQTGKQLQARWNLMLPGGANTLMFKAGDYLQLTKNYLPNSRALDLWLTQGGGVAAPTVTANSIVSPDGTTTAESISFPATGAAQFSDVFQVFTATPGQPYIFLCGLKSTGATTIQLLIQENVSPFRSALITASVTATWTEFAIPAWVFPIDSAGTQIFVALRNPASQGAKTIHAWGGCAYSTQADARIYKSLTDVTTDGAGNATLDIFPRLHESTTQDVPIIVTNPVGLFRLATNDQANWTVDVAKRYGIGVSAVEAL